MRKIEQLAGIHRALEEMFLANGARIGYWRGSIEGVAEDLQVHYSCTHLTVLPFLISSDCL